VNKTHSVNRRLLKEFAAGALHSQAVKGWTHNFYRYPARFSPEFASAAIKCFSRPGDLVFDPYMGGGTSAVEACISGRDFIGNDLNSLAVFVARVKTTVLKESEIAAVKSWAIDVAPAISYAAPGERETTSGDSLQKRNLTLVRAKFIKKYVELALATTPLLPTGNSRRFLRCGILRTAQWALDGRSKSTPLAEFRRELQARLLTMADQIAAFGVALPIKDRKGKSRCVLTNMDAARIDQAETFSGQGRRASFVLTSPPYPGVHMLYHRWQVDGRKETPAPYWIAGCQDGQGAAFYNFGGRRDPAAEEYFECSLSTLTAIRRVMNDGAFIVQLLAFNKPDSQLERYLTNMRLAGFTEVFPFRAAGKLARERIWRDVPNRRWHAITRGLTASSREVVLIHRAV
jgi:hypothetical protein